MPCRYPLEAAQIPGSGKRPVIYKAGTRPKTLAEGYEALDLPCGKCISCRLKHSALWGARITHECAFYWEEFNLPSSFITLTYDEKHLPDYGCLVKQHLQDFFKRLRERLRRRNYPEQIKYYASGEYGSRCPKHEIHNCPLCGTIQRPHYHAIVIGYAFPDRFQVGEREGLVVYESNELAELWDKGFHEIGSVSFESASYCARYVMKKVDGKLEDEGHYMRYCPFRDNWYEVPKEFAIMSTGHTKGEGIGGRWIQKYISSVYPQDELPVPGRGKFGGPPRYYDSIYEQSQPFDLEEIKATRRKKMAESLVQGPSLDSRWIHEDQRINKLKRNL
jgi:hypothetical protein